MKYVQSLLVGWLVVASFGCDSGTDRTKNLVVHINFTERRGTDRIDSSIDRQGKYFRGYSETSSDYYHTTENSKLGPELATEIWAAIDSGPFPEDFSSQESSGDFRSIGVTCSGTAEDGTESYGVSSEYELLEPGSPLFLALEIIGANQLDIWKTPPVPNTAG